ncbi:MAG TPA: hypothetical protein VES38_06715 [Methylotenera sp.]|nr:hypothetical protein [Methylotenera sp.]
MNPSLQHSDPLDIGADNAQNERDNGVIAIQALVKPIPTSEVCLQCDKPTIGGRRFCNSFCRDDWQQWNPEA